MSDKEWIEFPLRERVLAIVVLLTVFIAGWVVQVMFGSWWWLVYIGVLAGLGTVLKRTRR